MHHYRLRYDDFWSTGIWVGLRIFLIPAIIFSLFYLAKNDSRFDLNSQFGQALAPVQSSLAQISGQLGGTRSASNYFKPGPGAKWVRP